MPGAVSGCSTASAFDVKSCATPHVHTETGRAHTHTHTRQTQPHTLTNADTQRSTCVLPPRRGHHRTCKHPRHARKTCPLNSFPNRDTHTQTPTQTPHGTHNHTHELTLSNPTHTDSHTCLDAGTITLHVQSPPKTDRHTPHTHSPQAQEHTQTHTHLATWLNSTWQAVPSPEEQLQISKPVRAPISAPTLPPPCYR